MTRAPTGCIISSTWGMKLQAGVATRPGSMVLHLKLSFIMHLDLHLGPDSCALIYKIKSYIEIGAQTPKNSESASFAHFPA